MACVPRTHSIRRRPRHIDNEIQNVWGFSAHQVLSMHVRRRDARAAVVHGGSLYLRACVRHSGRGPRPRGGHTSGQAPSAPSREPRPGPRVRAGGLLRRLVAAWRHTVCEMGAVTWFSSVCGLTIAVSPGSASRCARLVRLAAPRRTGARPRGLSNPQPPPTPHGVALGLRVSALRRKNRTKAAPESPIPAGHTAHTRRPITCARPLPGSRANLALSRPPRPHRAHRSAG